MKSVMSRLSISFPRIKSSERGEHPIGVECWLVIWNGLGLGTLDVWEVVQRLGDGHVWTLTQKRRFGRMCGSRGHWNFLITRTDYEKSFAHLRNSVIGCVEQGVCCRVSNILDCLLKLKQNFTPINRYEVRYILEQECGWPRLREQPDVLKDEIATNIIETPAPPRHAEGLAWRPSSQELDRTASDLADIGAGHAPYIRLNPTGSARAMVQLEGLDTRSVIVDSRTHGNASIKKPGRETTSPAKKIDANWSAQSPPAGSPNSIRGGSIAV